MKKLLFVLAFTFIGQQAFSQMYLVVISGCATTHPSACNTQGANSAYVNVMTTVDPLGNITYDCLAYATYYDGTSIAIINQKFNSIISQGYKLIDSDGNNSLSGYTSSANTPFSNNIILNGAWYFAIPWTSSGLEEVATTLKSFVISPNPANTFVDISLDYSLKGESEVLFISEAGYISHKKSISNISKNEKYNIDISKIPAGKYLVTIVNGKTYTTPQKLIVI